jgi:hypothetical protein
MIGSWAEACWLKSPQVNKPMVKSAKTVFGKAFIEFRFGGRLDPFFRPAFGCLGRFFCEKNLPVKQFAPARRATERLQSTFPGSILTEHPNTHG